MDPPPPSTSCFGMFIKKEDISSCYKSNATTGELGSRLDLDRLCDYVKRESNEDQIKPKANDCMKREQDDNLDNKFPSRISQEDERTANYMKNDISVKGLQNSVSHEEAMCSPKYTEDDLLGDKTKNYPEETIVTVHVSSAVSVGQNVDSSGIVKTEQFSDPTMVENKTEEDTKCSVKAQELFKCENCGKCLSSLYNLKKHIRTHTGEKPFGCKLCDQSFSRQDRLKSHLMTHTGEKPFRCVQCCKGFSDHNTLKRHTRKHTGEKPFKCEDCGKYFTRQNNLRTHLRVHTGERPFKCEQCGKCFSEHRTMKKHIMTHTGEKPFSCVTCGKSFTFEYHLKRHTRTHNREQSFSCEQYGETFSKQRKLKIHTKTHATGSHV